jgi:hypothetical protein
MSNELKNAVTERDDMAIDAGHPPSAEGWVCVDFDGTLYPFGYLLDGPEPLQGAVAAMMALRNEGFKIAIYTSRLSPSWYRSEGWDRNEAEMEQFAYISQILTRDGIPFDKITCEKIPAIAYIDDKAVEFKGDWGQTLENFFKKVDG